MQTRQYLKVDRMGHCKGFFEHYMKISVHIWSKMMMQEWSAHLSTSIISTPYIHIRRTAVLSSK